MGDLFEQYDAHPRGPAWDEMFELPGVPRAAYRTLFDALQPLTAADLHVRAAALDRGFADRGVTFALSGEDHTWPLDVLPRILEAAEWSTLELGIAQRVRALEAFLADVYGRQTILDEGIVPRRLIVSSRHFHRQVHGLVPPSGVRIHIAGIDLVRAEDGGFRVLEDNLRCPSGVSYVLENRRAMTRVFPELCAAQRIRPVGTYPVWLRSALAATAPPGRDDPTIVVLTPGVHNAAYFEHTLLARLMGVELVEGRDLICRDNVVYTQSTSGPQRVDVIYRRIDDDYLDPVQFRPESLIGCPGLVNAARDGNVTVANAVGNGVADDKLVYTYVPDMIDFYLGERPIVPNVETYRLEDRDVLDWVLDHCEELVFKPVDASGGYGIVIGPQAADRELHELRQTVAADPRAWIAQRVVQLSTAPVYTEGGLAPRHLDLRPFAVNTGDGVVVLPGGLTRVALPAGSLVVNSSQGGGSKDTWVLPPIADPAAGPGRAPGSTSHARPCPPVAEAPGAAATGGPAGGQQ